MKLQGRAVPLDHVQVFLTEDPLPAADLKELRFWKSDPRYNRVSSFWENLKVKGGELRIFEELIPLLDLHGGEIVLELGAGQAWTSLMLKRLLPTCEIHASELSPEALLGAEKWERLFETRLDGYWACQAHRTPFADEQFDRVFTYEAFHHFSIGGRGREALGEALRVLKRHGKLVLLGEPCAPPCFYRWANAKLNRIRKEGAFDIEEDVLVLSRLKRWARELGASMTVRFDTSWAYRETSLPGVLRNAAVRWVPALGWLVPIGAQITFVREP